MSATSSSKRPTLLGRLYPERRFASFSRHEGRFLFYSLVAELCDPESVVLDFGAGRGAQIENSKGYIRRLIDFSGRCKRYIGVDPDPVVLQNPYLQEAFVLGPDGSIPLPDASVDLIVAYAVVEHIEDPAQAVREIERVLKPGGWFCAWTPNKYGYVGMAARLVPNRFHARIVRVADAKDRGERDVFPVRYRMNTKKAIEAAFGERSFDDFSFYENGAPSYHFNRMVIARFWQVVMSVLPRSMSKSLFIFVRKRTQAP
jgi:SAM-dependent methyltransferase